MKKIFNALCVCLLISFVSEVHALPRIKYSINENWMFMRQDVANAKEITFNDKDWQHVNLPHTWNNDDVMDDTPGYYQGVGWYRRNITVPASYSGKQITILFEGANQEVELFVNGKSAGTHVGGYTRFSFDITEYVSVGKENSFSIKVNNRYNENIPPLSADFTFFGGIYRDIFLIATSKQHISTTHYGSDGVYLHTPNVTKSKADIEIQTMLTNTDDTDKNVRIEHTIYAPDKNVLKTISCKLKLDKRTSDITNRQMLVLKNPELWSPDSPAIYSVRTRIYDASSNTMLDEVFQPLGLRWFKFCTQEGFVLNGKPYKLIGTNRHQCYDRIGNALPDEIHVRDVRLLKEMGGNFLRVSHYPQDLVVMEMCDKLGIITSVEIPIVNAITENKRFTRNCIEMTKEMIYQDYNRPSVMIWAYMNEVLLRLPFKDDSIKNEHYLQSVTDLASQIEKEIRETNTKRYTMIPFHGNFNLYHDAGLTTIPMIVGWNLYQGWYSDSFDKFDVFLDNAQKKLKDIPFIITEYGADVDPRLHSFDPVRFDYTQEWANLYHEHYIKAIMERKYVVGSTIWNLNDFHSEGRENAVPHINNKGIVSTTRQEKDTYLHYQALLNKKSIVNIGGRNWNIRGGVADDSYTCTQAVKVYSNLKEIEIFLNGVSLGQQKTENSIAQFNIPFVNGENILEAVGYSEGVPVRDLQKIDFRLIPNNLKDEKNPFESINVMLGSKRYFEEKDKSVIWIPEKPYSANSWGYIGGEKYFKRTRHGQQPASDSNILNTEIDPVFQTMRQGIESFKLDVPDGKYTVSLYFAELVSKNAKTSVYNLGNDALAEDFDERIFDVGINGSKVIQNLNIADEFGSQNAIIKKVEIAVENGKGISIDFAPIQDKAILNAIRVYRNY